MAYYEVPNDIEQLKEELKISHETNRRLNRKFQKSQSKLAKYRWRYLSLKNQAEVYIKHFSFEATTIREIQKDLKRFHKQNFCTKCFDILKK